MKRMLVTRCQHDAVHEITIGYDVLIAQVSRDLRIPGDRIPPEKWSQEHRDAADRLFRQFTADEIEAWDTWVIAGCPRLEIKQNIEEFFAELGVRMPDDRLPVPAGRDTRIRSGRPVLTRSPRRRPGPAKSTAA